MSKIEPSWTRESSIEIDIHLKVQSEALENPGELCSYPSQSFFPRNDI